MLPIFVHTKHFPYSGGRVPRENVGQDQPITHLLPARPRTRLPRVPPAPVLIASTARLRPTTRSSRPPPRHPQSPPLPLCCHFPSPRLHSATTLHFTAYFYVKAKPHMCLSAAADSKAKRLPAQSPILPPSRLIPSSVYSIPLTLLPPRSVPPHSLPCPPEHGLTTSICRFDTLAFTTPCTTHALMPPRRDSVA